MKNCQKISELVNTIEAGGRGVVMSVYRLKAVPGEEPHKWKPEKFAEIDWSEAFVRHMTELCTIVEATSIYGEEREELKNAIMTVLIHGLMPAFSQLRKIRESKDNPFPIMDRREEYHDFCRKLWKAYKDLTQRAATAARFDIGFVFRDEKEFTKGLPIFTAKFPKVRSRFADFVSSARARWQNDLAIFRNTFLEHQVGDPERFAKYYDANYVEKLFEDVWNTIVDLLAMLLESKIASGMKLGLPDRKQYPDWPNRFMFYLQP